MIFKNVKNGSVANVCREDLIEFYSSNPDWIQGTESDLEPFKFEIKEPTLTYEQEVSQMIHKIYSIDDEIALINNKDTKPLEYQEYQNYRNECKRIIKEKRGVI